ncbi:retinal pigment epithelial membrane family protein [Mycobacterium kansasii]|uniref:Dioxygenase n=1 Tax=Mycobacterium kansasii TaxID=1768 RepID=A0A1V3XHP1_MYCKA|nr:retinal pigment epithelial membrane family protein [Mycobacterium kansasii]
MRRPLPAGPLLGQHPGQGDLERALSVRLGVSAHPKVDSGTGELLFFNYSKQEPYMHYGVVDQNNELAHYVDIPLPGPRLPHDMAFTENYAILNDFPLFWDPRLLEHNVHLPRFYPDMPSRFAVIPRRGLSGDIRWFEAEPTFVLHFTNAYEDGDEIVLDGFYEADPQPLDTGGTKWEKLFRFLALDRLQTRLHRWRLNLVTGAVKEEQLSESITEFGTINDGYAARQYRYAYAATGKPGWFLFDGLVKHDLFTGNQEGYSFGDGVYGSETQMAPRVGGTAEDDGYLVTLTTDMNDDTSYCLVFDAARVGDGPVCKLQLPERISSGTHSTWVPGAELRRWHHAESPAGAVGL